MPKYRKFTSAAGTFLFPVSVKLAHAKLIRDAVTAQVVNRNVGYPKITNGRTARGFMESYVNGSHSREPFAFIKATSAGRG